MTQVVVDNNKSIRYTRIQMQQSKDYDISELRVYCHHAIITLRGDGHVSILHGYKCLELLHHNHSVTD